MDIHMLAEQARSCRRFDEHAPLSLADLEWLADCARLSPSARNAQAVRFVLVHTEKTCSDLFPTIKWAGALKDWDGPVDGERPTGYIALLVPEKHDAIVSIDMGIAMQSINLAAVSRGWGCCPIGAFNHPRATEILNVPAGYNVELILALGMAKEERHVVPAEEGASLTYYRDANGVHYVPKLGLETLVVGKI